MAAICKACGKEMTVGNGCKVTHFEYPDGAKVQRIKYGDDGWDSSVPCHDCNVTEGQYHHPGCDVEECPRCGGQFISCSCSD